MAAGSTANAAAMAAASTPSTICSISGVRTDAAMAGWAHTSISSSLRSGMPESSGISSANSSLPQSVSSSGTLVLLAADFHVSRSRLRATTSNQASGLSGTPSSGQRVNARSTASANASSAAAMSRPDAARSASSRP